MVASGISEQAARAMLEISGKLARHGLVIDPYPLTIRRADGHIVVVAGFQGQNADGETWGLVANEAMHQVRPVLATTAVNVVKGLAAPSGDARTDST